MNNIDLEHQVKPKLSILNMFFLFYMINTHCILCTFNAVYKVYFNNYHLLFEVYALKYLITYSLFVFIVYPIKVLELKEFLMLYFLPNFVKYFKLNF